MESFVQYLVYVFVTFTLTCVKVGAFHVQQIDIRQITQVGDAHALRPLAVSSSGVKEDGSVTLAVLLPGHTTQAQTPYWSIDRKGGDFQRIKGSVDKEHRWIVDVSNVGSAINVDFQIALDDQIVIISLFQFQQKTYYPIPRPDFSLQLDKTYTVREDHDLEIDVVVNGNYSQVQLDNYLSHGALSFIYVNTSSEPPEAKVKTIKRSEVIGTRLENLTNESTKLYITLKNQYAKFGGYLWVNKFQKLPLGYYVDADFIKILSPGLNEAVPTNTVGLYAFPDTVVLYKEYQASISCIAMGNPKPEVSIIKLPGYWETEIVPEAFDYISTEAIVIKHLRLSNSGPEAEGLYMCRAKSGTTIIEKTTEVYKFKLAVFDDSLTGVMRNSIAGVVISCQASGKPRPRLAIHASDPNGPDLTDLNTYQFSRTLIDDMTERVTITMSPSNPINTVYCKAQQERNRGDGIVRKIDVHPDPGEVGTIISEKSLW